MPRARNLKPAFFKDAKVVACSFEARLLFQGLWCLADYMGRLKYVPIEVKMELFPADSVDVEACMAELQKNGLIEIYTDHSGATLVQVLGFSKHQNPHVNERRDKNKNPLPCLPSSKEIGSPQEELGGEKLSEEQRLIGALVALREYSESDPADSLNLIPDPFNLIPNSIIEKILHLSGGPKKPAQSKSAKPNQKTQLPTDFELTDDLRKSAEDYWAEKDRQDLSADAEFGKFEAHHRGHGSRMADWGCAWKTWYVNAIKFNRKPSGASLSGAAGFIAGHTDRDWAKGLN